MRFPRALLPDPNLDPFFCQLVRVEGNELEPDFPDRSLIFVDRMRRELIDGGTFVLVTGGGRVVGEKGGVLREA